MKTTLQTIAVIATFAIASVASATTWGTAFDTLAVTDNQYTPDWKTAAKVDAGELVRFNIYYRAIDGPITDLVTKLDDITRRNFTAGQTYNMTASTNGKELSRRSGSVKLTFADNVKMEFRSASHQENKCQSSACGNHVSRSDLLGSGYDAGVVPTGNWGNIVVTFRAVATKKTTTTTTTDNKDNDDVTTNRATSVRDDSARLQGELERGNNLRVWFAFDDEDDTTPSCASSSQRYSVSGSYDGGDDFSLTINNLDENEDYFFRACVENENGNTISGSIRSFTTGDEDTNGNDSDADVTTNKATNVDEDSARLQGELESGDNLRVWFAFDDEDDTTPSCASSSQRHSVSGSYDDGDDFSLTIRNLRENEDYFFRACVEDENGDTVSGSIRSFTTDDDDDTDNNNRNDRNDRNNGNNSGKTQTVTSVPTGVSATSATFNSIVLGNDDAVCYFEYGRSQSFGLTSPRVNVDLDSKSACSSYRSGLASNSTYYYRSVIEQDGDRFFGSTRTFRTTGTSASNPSNPTTTVTIVNKNIPSNGGLEITKWVSSDSDARFDTEVAARAGESVFYRVQVTNNTNKDLQDLVVTDRIPSYLELNSSDSLNNDEEKQLRWVIDLDKGDSRTFITEMRVRKDVPRGEEIFSFATVTSKGKAVDSNDVVIDIQSGSADNQSASIFGSDIFPTNLVGWGILALIVLAIAFVISKMVNIRAQKDKMMAAMSTQKSQPAQSAQHNA